MLVSHVPSLGFLVESASAPDPAGGTFAWNAHRSQTKALGLSILANRPQLSAVEKQKRWLKSAAEVIEWASWMILLVLTSTSISTSSPVWYTQVAQHRGALKLSSLVCQSASVCLPGHACQRLSLVLFVFLSLFIQPLLMVFSS